MSMQVRLILTIALSLAILTAYSALRPRPAVPPPTPAGTAEEDDTPPPAQSAGEAGTGAKAPPAPPADVSGSPPAAADRHEVATDLLALEVTNTRIGRRGLVEAVRLRSEQFAGHPTGTDPFDLGDAGTFRIVVTDEGAEAPLLDKQAAYEVVERTERTYVVAREQGGVRAAIALEATGGYEGRLTVTLENRRTTPLEHVVALATRVGKSDSRYDVRRGLCHTDEDLEDADASDVEDAPVRIRGAIPWGGSDAKYFASLLVGERPFASCTIEPAGEGDRIETTLRTEKITVPPGGRITHTFGWYVGAKELERLQAFSVVPVGGASLEEAIDWGYLGAISESLGKVLLRLLRWIHGWLGSWGLSILLLTVLVKAVTLPLTLKQMASMRRMKEIQPEINKIKEKYADDRVRQGQELQALFSRSGVHPLAGCLPMLIQIPVWFALYSMLLTAVELVHQPFLWLPDLTQQDPFFVLPLGIGASMYLQNRMMPNTMDEAQAKMMRTIMPVMFTAIMLFLPAGLGLYILTNIVLSVIQTAVQMRVGGGPAAAAEGA